MGTVFILFLLSFSMPVRGASLELYGTLESIGVSVALDAGDDDDGDAAAVVEYRTGEDAYRQGFPLSRVTADTQELLAGSLFRLDEGTSYDVRVTCSDPDGGPLDGFVLSGNASTRSGPSLPPAENSYYVAPSGNDQNGDGSLGRPWATLSHAVQQAYAGDEVVLRGGVYHEGQVSLPRSGEEGAPIVIRGYAGESAILDGSDPQTFSWASQGNGVYLAAVNGQDANLVVSDGQRLLRYSSLSDLQDLKWGIPGCYVDGTSIYVKLAGGADPNNTAMAVSRYNYGLSIARNWIDISDLTFRHYGCSSYAKAVYLNNASDNLIQGCTFALNDCGIAIKRASHRNVIQDSEFYDTVFSWPWEAFYDGIQAVNGIVIYTPHSGRGTVIRRNLIHDLFDGMIVCPAELNPFTNETDVSDNTVYNCCDDGMETDGQCSNVRIWGNTFHDMVVGISLAPVYSGPVYAIRNLFYRTGAGNNDWPGSPFKFNSGYGLSGLIYLFHNTCDAALPGFDGLEVKTPGTWELIYARNNIWGGTRYALNDYNTEQPIDLDYDNLWNGQAGDLVSWNWVAYATLSAFTAATGQEVHGRSVDPGYVDEGNGDYGIGSGSGLVDAAVLIPGINDIFLNQYVGSAPDIGAFEHTPYSPWDDEDGDGLLNYQEDVNMDGQVDEEETDVSDADTDDDGFSDMVEVRSGSGPADPDDIPARIHINFAPADLEQLDGFCPDSAATYSSARNYGWMPAP